MKLWPFILISTVIVLCIAAAVATCSGVSNSDMGKHALEEEGWKDVFITESGPVVLGLQGCGDDDSVYFEATGKNPAGKDAHALVCCGVVFKACTVRIKQ
jgi:hypothetical protein